MCDNDASGFYIGGELPGWHGSLCATDMTIPIILSYPTGSSMAAVDRFNGIVDRMIPDVPPQVEQARITDIHHVIWELLTAPQ